MQSVSIIGLDLAKNVFQAYGTDATGSKLFNKRLKREELMPFLKSIEQCTVAMEACGSAHYWAREIEALGHKALIIPGQYVKPFVKRDKTDATDAQAIAVAARQEGMTFVPIKTANQQALTVMVKTRALFVRQKFKAYNAIRGHLAEFGLITNRGISALDAMARKIGEEPGQVPADIHWVILSILEEVDALSAKITRLERQITATARASEDVPRLMSIPGVGPLIASTLIAYVPNIGEFKSSRHFSSWLGLVPKVRASGDKSRTGSISKRGNTMLRSLLFISGLLWLQKAKRVDFDPWVKRLVQRKPPKVAAVAIANKIARIMWALMSRKQTYVAPALVEA